ncbi:DUF2934 domain-containing protein [Rhizobium sp.]|jgi:hypothetical protein|uniref:DUF2934 domain-containing protein n=1 Tax=Rhizobium sp. TaxID=391 RepID=UPI000E7FC51C|nr:DUF2934 domain-containing protein [Rhizobium sp.]
MTISKQQWIETRAYHLWEADGRPQGHHDLHWQQASEEFNTLLATTPVDEGVEPKKKTTRRSRKV